MSLFPLELLSIISNHFPFKSITAAESSTSSVRLGPRPLSPSEWELSEINYGETVFIASPLWGRGGSCGEQPSDTLSHSPALIVQKMWFVPPLYFPGKRGCSCGWVGALVAWAALLFNLLDSALVWLSLKNVISYRWNRSSECCLYLFYCTWIWTNRTCT